MSYDTDSADLRHRHAQEQYLARHAEAAAVRRLHLDLASRYAEPAADMERLALTPHM